MKGHAPHMQILRAVMFVLLLLVPAAAFAGEGGHGAAAPAAEELPIGTEAPAFMLPPINAAACGVKGMLSINQYRNRDDETRPKAYLLTFFATWCEPCKKELPQLQALYVKNAPRGLVIVDVSIDTADQSYDGLSALLAKHGITFPVVWDKYSVMGKRYKVSRLPYVILLDGDARVVKSMVGYDEGAFAHLVADIEALLTGGVPAPAAAPAGHPQKTPAAQPAAPAAPYGTAPDWSKQ